MLSTRDLSDQDQVYSVTLKYFSALNRNQSGNYLKPVLLIKEKDLRSNLLKCKFPIKMKLSY